MLKGSLRLPMTRLDVFIKPMLGGKLVRAKRAPERQIRPHPMHLQMPRERPSLCKPLVAHEAFELLLPSVHRHVNIERLLHRERLVTHRTHKPLDTRVEDEMSLQITPGEEGTATQCAFIRLDACVYCHMVLEDGFLGEGFVAGRTDEPLFLTRSRVNSAVDF